MGAHDANFHGDQLRLTVLLRIVGDGLSSRPVRRNRRALVADQGSQTSRECSDISSSKYSRPPASSAVDSHTSLPDTGGEVTEEVRCLASVSSKWPSPKPETLKIHLQAGAVKTPTRSQGSSQAQKGELFVNELSLLRTTSSHGLPHPSDVDITPAAHITESDPIEDGQNISLCTASSYRSNASAQRFPSCQTHRLSPIMLTKDVASAMKSSPRKGREKGLPTNLDAAFDGFVGAELNTKSRSRQIVQQRKHRTSSRRKTPNSRGLVLASGALPMPIEDRDGRIKLR